jgi:hypothetical protein
MAYMKITYCSEVAFSVAKELATHTFSAESRHYGFNWLTRQF